MSNPSAKPGAQLEAGDIITSYSKGFFRVARIERRFYTPADEKHFDFLEKKCGTRPRVGDEYSPLVHSRKLLTSQFRKQSGVEKCDLAFCALVPADIRAKIEALIQADPSIEENSLRKYREMGPASPAPEISDSQAEAMASALAQIKPGQPLDQVLVSLCPQLFAGWTIANGFVNRGKPLAVHLNGRYALRIVYDELPGMITQFVSGEITKKEPSHDPGS